MIIAAADGSALGNPGPAGWAWYVDDDCWAAGGWKHATNNQGELKAVLELFRATAHVDDELLVLCDSQYVINAVTKWMPGWKRKGWRKADGKPVMNVELLQELDEALAGRRYRFEWVRGPRRPPAQRGGRRRGPAPSPRPTSAAASRSRPVPAGPAARPRPRPRSADSSRRIELDRRRRRHPPTSPMADADADDAALFSLDEVPAAWHTLTLELSTEEHDRLLQRARSRGPLTRGLPARPDLSAGGRAAQAGEWNRCCAATRPSLDDRPRRRPRHPTPGSAAPPARCPRSPSARSRPRPDDPGGRPMPTRTRVKSPRVGRLRDVADAVVAAVPAALLQAHGVERDVELVVHDDEPLDRERVELHAAPPRARPTCSCSRWAWRSRASGRRGGGTPRRRATASCGVLNVAPRRDASSSATIWPTLCRLPAYCAPGLPSPTTSQVFSATASSFRRGRSDRRGPWSAFSAGAR